MIWLALVLKRGSNCGDTKSIAQPGEERSNSGDTKSIAQPGEERDFFRFVTGRLTAYTGVHAACTN